jgi:hypothetical protein
MVLIFVEHTRLINFLENLRVSCHKLVTYFKMLLMFILSIILFAYSRMHSRTVTKPKIIIALQEQPPLKFAINKPVRIGTIMGDVIVVSQNRDKRLLESLLMLVVLRSCYAYAEQGDHAYQL